MEPENDIVGVDAAHTLPDVIGTRLNDEQSDDDAGLHPQHVHSIWECHAFSFQTLFT